MRLNDGRVLRYDRLLLATGSRPRNLVVPGADLAGVHYCARSRTSTRSPLRLQPSARVVMIGAGYIGLEVAAVARSAGSG